MSQSKHRTGADLLGAKVEIGSGLQSAMARLEPAIATRTPRVAMSAGVVQTPTGAIITPRRRQSTPSVVRSNISCPLGALSSGTQQKTKKIKGGFLIAGTEAVYLEIDNVTPAVGKSIYIDASIEVDVSSKVLMNSFTLNNAALKASMNVPSSDRFTVDSPSGSVTYKLGEWVAPPSDSAPNTPPMWKMTGCGAVLLKMCHGAPLIVRNGFSQASLSYEEALMEFLEQQM